MANQEEKLWSTTEAAEYLEITRQAVHALAKRGEIGERVGRAWVFRKSELDAWLAKPRPHGGRPPKSFDLIPSPVIRAAA